jgi:transketolase
MLQRLLELASYARRDILRMTSAAASGHPGGSLSSIDIFLVLLAFLREDGRDRLVVSHGHTAAGLYAALGRFGYFDPEVAVRGFRRMGSIFEGHPSSEVPGVSWCSGALGQGLSVGCGFALAARRGGTGGHVFVVMGDGEQAKGQLFEARLFATQHGLRNLTAIVDYNGLQASGATSGIMAQDIAAQYEAVGWRADTVDGHDHLALHSALEASRQSEAPTLLLARTVMGKGVPGYENRYEFHGAPLRLEEMPPQYVNLAGPGPVWSRAVKPAPACRNTPLPGRRRVYGADTLTDMRSAFGSALLDIADRGSDSLAVFVCDLRESLKLAPIGELHSGVLIEGGIAEQNALTASAAMAKEGFTAWYAGFGSFAVGEVYSQLRMAAINYSPLKIAATHCGLDVGEDGKTHQCLDYLSLLSNLPGMRVLMPADPNHADLLTRYATAEPGAFCLCMGRSRLPVLTGEDDTPFYGEAYRFRYGEGDWLRQGKDAVIIAIGGMAGKALEAHSRLLGQGIRAAVYVLGCIGVFDEGDLREAAATGLIVSVEDHFVQNGIGAMTAAYLMEKGFPCKFRAMGATHLGHSASPDELYAEQGLTSGHIAAMVAENI